MKKCVEHCFTTLPAVDCFISCRTCCVCDAVCNHHHRHFYRLHRLRNWFTASNCLWIKCIHADYSPILCMGGCRSAIIKKYCSRFFNISHTSTQQPKGNTSVNGWVVVINFRKSYRNIQSNSLTATNGLPILTHSWYTTDKVSLFSRCQMILFGYDCFLHHKLKLIHCFFFFVCFSGNMRILRPKWISILRREYVIDLQNSLFIIEIDIFGGFFRLERIFLIIAESFRISEGKICKKNT